MPRFVQVAKKSQIPENGAIGVEVEGKRLALVNLKGEIYALDDDCPQEAGPLSVSTQAGATSISLLRPRVSAGRGGAG